MCPGNRNHKRYVLSALLLLPLLTGCLGDSASTTKRAAVLPPSILREDYPYSYTPTQLAGYTYSATNIPAWATLDPATGKLSGCPTDGGTLPDIEISATKGTTVKKVATISLSIAGDPLVRLSWHLGNTGQTGFATNPGTPGEDMKVREALCDGATGAGVKIAVSDTGVEIGHEDLQGNVIAGASKDYNASSPYFGNPAASANLAEGQHGTEVAGIAASVAGNNIGTHGIAPSAGLAGLNYLSYQNVPGVEIDQLQGDYDVFNESWGPGFSAAANDPVGFVPFDDPNYLAALKSGVTNGRHGKGYLYVRAAGNDYFYSNLKATVPYAWRARNACMEMDNSNPYVVIVGATNAKGKKSSYSSTGSCLWIAGLGGEFGYSRTVTGAFPLYGVNDPAIISTDFSGCSKGSAITPFAAAPNPFESGSVAANASCNYSATMNGTSSATPSIVGVIALILEANPNLSWRDVKDILAKTAIKIDATTPPLQNGLDPLGYLPDAGWVTNAAGFSFNNFYGFGRANAQAAVAMAKTYVSQMGTQVQTTNAAGVWKYTRTVNLAINDNNVTAPTAVDNITVTENRIIENVQIRVSVTHPFSGDIGIELISPQGTKSTMLNTNNANNTANLADVTILSNAFYGESSVGVWTIRVLDGLAGQTGSLTNWKLNIIGH